MISPHHKVAESDVVVHGNLALGNASVETLLVQLNILQDAEGKMVVACEGT